MIIIVRSKIKRASLMSMAQQANNNGKLIYNSNNVVHIHVIVYLCCTGQDIEISLPPRPPSSNAILSSVKVRPPTGKARRTTEPALSMSSKKLSKSSENLLFDGVGAPQRVQSKPSQKSIESTNQRPSTPTRQRFTSGRDSPSGKSKGSASLSRKAISGLSQDAVKQFVSYMCI